MLSTEIAKEILKSLATLPADKVIEVRDFVGYLKDRYSRKPNLGLSDEWSDEDLRDLNLTVLRHAEESGWTEDRSNAQPG